MIIPFILTPRLCFLRYLYLIRKLKKQGNGSFWKVKYQVQCSRRADAHCINAVPLLLRSAARLCRNCAIVAAATKLPAYGYRGSIEINNSSLKTLMQI